MKFNKLSLLAVVALSGGTVTTVAGGNLRSRSLLTAGCPGSEASFDFRLNSRNGCNYETVRNAINNKKTEACAITDVDTLTLNLLNVTTVEEAEVAVRAICKQAYDATDIHDFAFADITKRGDEFDNEYYSGGTYYNYEVQTNSGLHELKEDAARVRRIKENEAETKIINLPTYLKAFDPHQNGCDYDAAYCCWVQDRQAGDNNGNCNTPYDSQCIDRDPADNANFCYTDHSKSQSANNIAGGFSIFGDLVNNKENIEGPIHCHGFAWAQDETHESNVYKGNNLFFVSLFDHMYQRGYVRNAPGAPMCGCAENMAVVTRADCTEIDAKEIFDFTYDVNTTSFSGILTAVDDINFNACQGANGRNNDLEAYYERLVNEGKQPAENLVELRKQLVGATNGQCNTAIKDFLRTKGIITKSEAEASSAMAAGMTDPAMAESMELAEASDPNEVAYMDPAYDYEEYSREKDGMMPDVPTDHETDEDAAAPTEETELAESAGAIIADEDEATPVDEEDKAPEREPELAPLEIDVDGRVETDDGDATVAPPTGTALPPAPTPEPPAPTPEPPTLKEDGEDCESNDECMSGKCTGSGKCSGRKKRLLAGSWFE